MKVLVRLIRKVFDDGPVRDEVLRSFTIEEESWKDVTKEYHRRSSGLGEGLSLEFAFEDDARRALEEWNKLTQDEKMDLYYGGGVD